MENRAPTRKPPAKIGYARVSTKDQTLDLQVDALKKAGCIKVLTEVVGRVVECQAAGDQSPVAGPLASGRTQELQHEMLAAGIPL